jgi:hypothetical protein
MTDRHAGTIQIRPGHEGRLIVLVPYSPERVAKIKTVAGRRRHQNEKYWTVPHTDEAFAQGGNPQARHLPHVPPLVCHARA